jgi:hypothetical protein
MRLRGRRLIYATVVIERRRLFLWARRIQHERLQEPARRRLVQQQRLDFPAQFLVVAAGALKKGRAVSLIDLTCVLIQAFDLTPPI